MTAIGRFLTSAGADLAQLHNYNSEADQTLGAFFALALVDADVLDATGNPLRLDGTFNGTVQTVDTIVATIKALCKTDQAYFFGLGQIEGSEADPTAIKEVDIYGTAAGQALTDTITGTIIWKIKHAYGARKFLNMLMSGRKFDLFMFRNNAVEFAGADDHGVVYDAMSNNSTNRDVKINGGFTMMYKSYTGFLEAHLGITQSSLKNDVRFIMDDIVATTAVAAACTTLGRKKFTFVNGGSAGTLAFALDPINDCVEWYCTQADGSALPSDDSKGSFDSATQTLTLPTALAPGKYIYKVFAVNLTGIKGEVMVEVVVTAP